MNDLIKIFRLTNLKQKKTLFFLFLLSLIVVVAEAVSLTMILPLITILINPSYIQNINTEKGTILDKILEQLLLVSKQFGDQDILMFVIISFIIIIFIKNIIVYLHFSKLTYFVHEFEKDLSKKILKNYLHQNYLYFIRNSISYFMSRLITDLPIVSRSVMGSAVIIFTESFMIIIFVLLIIWLKLYEIGLIFLIFFTAGYLVLRFLNFINKRLGIKREKYDTEKYKLLNNIISNIKFINLYNKSAHFLDKFLNIATNVALTQHKQIKLQIIPRLFFEILATISLCTVIFYMVINNYKIENIMSVTGFLLASSYRVIPSLQKIISSFQNIKYGLAATDKILKDANLKDEISYTSQNLDFKKNIKIQNLTHKYENRDDFVFKNTELEIKKGSKIGILGESGSGKTTIVEILSGLISPDKGTITIDNIKLDTPKLVRAWQDKIGYVSQNTMLLNDSIYNNISFYSDKKDLTLEFFNDILKKVKLIEFVNFLPEKSETQLGELGNNISGGQKQRIGIARALYKNPEIIIFDEATSALDLNSESQIIKTIFELPKNITTIIISHKKNLLDECDHVYEIKNHKII